MSNENNPWGQGGGNNPWGKKGQNQPPDLDKILEKIFSFLKGDKGPGQSDKGGEGKGFLTILLVVLALYFGYQAFYQIQPGELGVVLRLGKFDRTAMPGANFIIPLVEEMNMVNVEAVRKEEFGFRVSGVSNNRNQSRNEVSLESLMLTGDKNVINVRWVVQYKILSPEDYLFNVKNVRATVRDISETVIRRLVGNRGFDYLLVKREDVAMNAQKEMQDLLNKYKSGVKLVTVQLRDVNPPDAVRAAFNEVNEADQDLRRLVNEAQAVYNDKVPKARGVAKQAIEEAKGYEVQRVNRAKGDVARFNSILKEYKSAKEVTRQRMYIETMQEILPNLTEIIIVDQNMKGIVPLLDINRSLRGGSK